MKKNKTMDKKKVRIVKIAKIAARRREVTMPKDTELKKDTEPKKGEVLGCHELSEEQKKDQ